MFKPQKIYESPQAWFDSEVDKEDLFRLIDISKFAQLLESQWHAETLWDVPLFNLSEFIKQDVLVGLMQKAYMSGYEYRVYQEENAT